MRRHAYRRWIVSLALLCQVLTATLVHVPAAYAAQAVPLAEALPCPDHAPLAGDGPSAGESARDSGDQEISSGHSGYCGSGACKCPCVHPPAMASNPSLPSTTATLHFPVLLAYVPPTAPLRTTSFFRPPI